MKLQSSLLPLLTTAALALLPACSSLKTVNVRQDAGLTSASIAVDVIPVTAKTPNLDAISVREYWRPGSAARQAAGATTLRFGVGQANQQSVTKNWKALGAKKVLVIADLPGVFQDLPGDADARRESVPVSKAATVTVRVSPTGLSVE